MKNYNLTSKELDFVDRFFRANGCGAATWKDLSYYNYSWQDMEDLRAIFPEYNDQKIGGFLASLLQKGVLHCEERQGDSDLFCFRDNYVQHRNKSL